MTHPGPGAAGTHGAPARPADPAPPATMVIFGAAGDLTKRLVVPALYNLVGSKLLPDQFRVIGADLAKLDAAGWRDGLAKTLESFVRNAASEFAPAAIDQAAWDWLASRMEYVQGDLTEDALYQAIAEKLGQKKTNVLFYLAVADRFFEPVVQHLGKAGLVETPAPDPEKPDEPPSFWRRVVIEKPFGHDLASAKALNRSVLSVLREDQTYRIDHFLGKETVQNILALRFANGLFEPIWNRHHIDHVQITVAETLGVELRGKFYEVTGAMRDMVPNHVFQLLAMTAMEAPNSFDADAVRAKKAEIFEAVRKLEPQDFVRGQYAEGMIEGKPVVAYNEERDVAPDSATETYVAMRLWIDNWRWAGVPFYLRTGKRMSRRTTEIAIQFKQAPFTPFRRTGVEQLGPNWLVLQIQPDEGISLQFDAKRPGPLVDLSPVRMEFKYKDWFPDKPNVGYETLIYDCMIGDQTLFQRADQVEGGWRAVEPALDYWGEVKPGDFPNYMAGTAGPAAADLLLAQNGHTWRSIMPHRHPKPEIPPSKEPEPKQADAAKTGTAESGKGTSPPGAYGQLRVAADPDAVAAEVAAWLCQTVEAVSGERVAIALSGGSTPKRLYQALAAPPFAGRFPWPRVLWFWGDERFVPQDHADSNYRMVHEAMLSKVPVPPENVFAVPTMGVEPDDAAKFYEATLRGVLGGGRGHAGDGPPLFTVTLLGLGGDGHTASLMPGTAALGERERWAVAVPKDGGHRISLTYPVLDASHHIAFMVTGEEKRAILAEIRSGHSDKPAARLKPAGDLLWFADRAAAG